MPLATKNAGFGLPRKISRRAFLKASSFSLLASSLISSDLFFTPSEARGAVVRKRLRDLGITIGELPPGNWNAITDVPGVRVGHQTRIVGEAVRTGVTVIFPNDDVFRNNVAAAHFIMNGNGEMTGLGNVDAAGLLESPIFLTDTSNIGRVMNGALSWFLQTYPEIGESVSAPVPVIAETFADFLHDHRGRHLLDEDVFAAIANAQAGAVGEGAVGGGTGMLCYEFKGGIGTASRLLPENHGGYTIGVLVQANHGSREQLTINGVPVGKEISDLMPHEPKKQKSIILIGATDAPMLPSQLQRLCKRLTFGLARTGSISSHGSGDLMLFFSTGLIVPRNALRPASYEIHGSGAGEVANFEIFNDEFITLAHQAAIEAAEEAILNSLCMANTMTGINGNTAYALPIERLPEIMRKYGHLESKKLLQKNPPADR
jgi:D-aminopeptidase